MYQNVIGLCSFPCCKLFISYVLRFSQPQIYILGLHKFEIRTTRVHRKYNLVKAALQGYPRWPRKSPRKHNSLKPWFVHDWTKRFFHVWETRFAYLIGRSKIRNTFSHRKIWCENLSMYEIIYNYSPKGRWIVVDIYRDAKRRGIHLFQKTLSERTANGCCRTEIARPKRTVISTFGMQKQWVLRVALNWYCRANGQLAPA